MTTHHMDDNRLQNMLTKWGQAGLLVGLFIVYVSAIGMLQTFHERELVDGAIQLSGEDNELEIVITLGQFLLVVPGLMGAYWLALTQKTPVLKLAVGAVVGIVGTILPVALVLLASSNESLGDMFININRQMLELLTFERETTAEGIPILILAIFFSSIAGSVLAILPQKPRRILVAAIAGTLLTTMLGEMVSQILDQIVAGLATIFTDIDERRALRPIINRDTFTAVGAIVVFFITGALATFWTFAGQRMQQSYVRMANASEERKNSPDSAKRTVILVAPYIVLLLFLIILPQLTGSFLSQVMFQVGLYVLMGLGLNIAVGLSGLLDLGYVTNFAVGAYLGAFLTSTGPLGFAANGGAQFTLWTVLPIALVAAMMTGFMFALPVLRMRGDYLAIATLGFGEIIQRLAVSDWFKPIIGGAQGLKQVGNPPFVNIEFTEPEQFYYIILIICIIMVFVSVRLNNSRIGRQWMAIREDEDAASAMGIDTARSKLLAFTLSAAIGGVSGAVFASRVGAVFPNSFTLIVSLNVLSIIIVGGMGSIPGIVLGSFFLIGMPEVLREFSEYRFLIYGALLVIMMLVRPEGLWPSRVRRREIAASEGIPDDEVVVT